jgi:transcriptional regulator with XRE-family HTH domain
MGNNFRENLRSELNFQGVAIKELSARTGIPVATLDCYLGTRATVPSVEAAFKIAQALRVSIESLLIGEKASGESFDIGKKASSESLVIDKKASKEYHPKKICREAREIIRWIESLNAEQCRGILNVIATFKASS